MQCGALLLAVWCGAVRLCHFVSGFGVVFAVYAIWWTPLTQTVSKYTKPMVNPFPLQFWLHKRFPKTHAFWNRNQRSRSGFHTSVPSFSVFVGSIEDSIADSSRGKKSKRGTAMVMQIRNTFVSPSNSMFNLKILKIWKLYYTVVEEKDKRKYKTLSFTFHSIK